MQGFGLFALFGQALFQLLPLFGQSFGELLFAAAVLFIEQPFLFGQAVGKKTFLLGQSFTKLFFLCGQSFGVLLPDGFQPLLGNCFLSFDTFVGCMVQQVFTLLCGFKLRFQCGCFTPRNQHPDACPDAQSYNQ